MKQRDTFTTYDIARMIGVAPSTVIHWIKQGNLKAFTTPGGHYRITRQTLLPVLLANKVPLPSELLGRNLVYIVDDEPEICSVLSRAFAGYGELFETAVFSDPLEALVRIGVQSPALVVLDIVMPRMDGYHVCDILRSTEKTSGVKIIAVSGKKPLPSPEKLREHRIDAFFPKPLELDALTAKAASLLGIETPSGAR
jgi:excisionase family DNA binding protein